MIIFWLIPGVLRHFGERGRTGRLHMFHTSAAANSNRTIILKTVVGFYKQFIGSWNNIKVSEKKKKTSMDCTFLQGEQHLPGSFGDARAVGWWYLSPGLQVSCASIAHYHRYVFFALQTRKVAKALEIVVLGRFVKLFKFVISYIYIYSYSKYLEMMFLQTLNNIHFFKRLWFRWNSHWKSHQSFHMEVGRWFRMPQSWSTRTMWSTSRNASRWKCPRCLDCCSEFGLFFGTALRFSVEVYLGTLIV